MTPRGESAAGRGEALVVPLVAERSGFVAYITARPISSAAMALMTRISRFLFAV
jgi:hypothetical protein